MKIKKGWINRNRLLLDGKAHAFTFSLKKASHRLPIKERYFVDDHGLEKASFMGLMALAYRKAPHYRETAAFIENLLDFDELNVAEFIRHSLEEICKYLGIKTSFHVSSRLKRTEVSDRLSRLLGIMAIMGSTQYINPIGGRELYSKEEFAGHGMTLNFLRTKPIPYRQGDHAFVESLSIIDVMMFNSRDEIRRLLTAYEFF